VLNLALAVGMPLLTKPLEVGQAIAAGAANRGKHNKRYDPYVTQKGKCKPKGSTNTSSTPTSPTDSGSPYPPILPGFADPSMAMMPPHYYSLPAYLYPLGFSMAARYTLRGGWPSVSEDIRMADGAALSECP